MDSAHLNTDPIRVDAAWYRVGDFSFTTL